MKKLLFFVLVCGVMSACSGLFNQNYHFNIPQDHIPLLENNDRVYFQDSVSSKIDTLDLSIANSWNQKDHDSFQELYVSYKKPNSKNSLLDFRITTANVGGVTFFIYFDYMKLYSSQQEVSNFTLSGVSYQNLYVLQNVTPDITPNTVYFTYKNGIIRYEYKDGRVYNLLSK